MAGDVKKEEQSMERETYTLEQNFARLEEALSRLAQEDIPLEEAFAAYSEGMQILKQCNAQIDRVEKKVLKITEDGGLEEL